MQYKAHSEGMEEYGYVDTDPTGRYGRYREILGKGAMKTVYRAFDEVLGMEVAWNMVSLNDVFRSPDELQRLYSEVHLLSTLGHDSIIRSYTSWINVDKRTFNFITEMFTSGTLREYRERHKRVDIRAVKRWARQILNGLVYLHGHDPPVIHRDLKCDNIFVNGHLGQVKIGDLGLAAILRGSLAHSVIGTPEFMAPELYEEEYNELVDIYSFGMCVLEMVTSEYPYSECCNPAQIYKKVTSGKLPNAFYRIHDLEARRFVGRCLEKASERLSANELLLDTFLAFDEAELFFPSPNIRIHKSLVKDTAATSSAYLPMEGVDSSKSANMKITGKMNSEDDTIFLKVQMADNDGHVRHIYFPFDIISDTPIDVATEMVKELEITDRKPREIAYMIEKEISTLIPHWKEWDLQDKSHHTFSFQDDDDNEGLRPPFYPFSSCSSSQTSLSGPLPSSEAQFYHEDDRLCGYDWLQGEPYPDEESSSQSSSPSAKYSNMNYNCRSEHEHDYDLHHQGRHPYDVSRAQKCTRFCPEEIRSDHITNARMNRRLTRINSCVDVRSQLLHRTLLEEVNKRRLFKTVGAVENIGYQAPCEE